MFAPGIRKTSHFGPNFSKNGFLIESKYLKSFSATVQPSILLKTRNSQHSISIAALYGESPVFAQAYRDNPNIKEYFVDIDDPNDYLYDFVNVIHKPESSDGKSTLKNSNSQFYYEIGQVLKIPSFIIESYNFFFYLRMNHKKDKITQEHLDQIAEIQDIQNIFLELDLDNLVISQNMLIETHMLETEIGIELLFSTISIASYARPHIHQLLIKIVTFIFENAKEDAKSIFFRMAVNKIFGRDLSLLPILADFLDNKIYSAQTVFDAIYPNCLHSSFACQIFGPEIFEVDPIIFQNLNYYDSDNNDLGFAFSRPQRLITMSPEMPDDNFEKFRELRRYGNLKNSIIYAIENDDIDMLQEYASAPDFNFLNEITCSRYSMYYSVINRSTILGIAAFFGSIKCFKYILLSSDLPNNDSNNNNQWGARKSGSNIEYCAIAGGNLEIIRTLEQHKRNLVESVAAAVAFHHQEVLEWITQNNINHFSPKTIKNRRADNIGNRSSLCEIALNRGNISSLIYMLNRLSYKFFGGTNLYPLTILYVYVRCGFPIDIKSLLIAAARSDAVEYFHYIETTQFFSLYDADEYFFAAVSERSMNVISFFLSQKEFNVNIGPYDITPYEIAASREYDDISKMLIDHGSYVTPMPCWDTDGWRRGNTGLGLSGMGLNYPRGNNMGYHSQGRTKGAIFRLALETEPDFTITTKLGSFKVHKYIIVSISNCIQKAYIDNPDLQEYNFDVEFDMTPFIPFLKGLKIPYDNDESFLQFIDIIQATNFFNDIIAKRIKNNEVDINKVYNDSKDTIDLQHCFLDLTKENLEETKTKILSNAHYKEGNFLAIVDSILLTIRARPFLQFILVDIVEFLVSKIEGFKNLLLSMIFDINNNSLPSIAFSIKLMEKEVITKEEMMKHVIYAIQSTENSNTQNIIKFFAPEIEEFDRDIIQYGLQFNQDESYLNIRKFKKDNWKLLKEFRLHGEAIGSVLYNIKNDFDDKLDAQLPEISINEKYSSSPFEPYSELKNAFYLTSYALFYGAKKCYDLLISNGAAIEDSNTNENISYFPRSFSEFAIISGFEKPIDFILYEDDVEYNQSKKNILKSILMISSKYFRIEYFIKYYLLSLEIMNMNDLNGQKYFDQNNFEVMIFLNDVADTNANNNGYKSYLISTAYNANRKDNNYISYSQSLISTIDINPNYTSHVNRLGRKGKYLNSSAISNISFDPYSIVTRSISLDLLKYVLSVSKCPLNAINDHGLTILDGAIILEKKDFIDLLKENKCLSNKLLSETNYSKLESSNNYDTTANYDLIFNSEHEYESLVEMDEEFLVDSDDD